MQINAITAVVKPNKSPVNSVVEMAQTQHIATATTYNGLIEKRDCSLITKFYPLFEN